MTLPTSWPLLRGQVIRADLGLAEPKLFVVVSNNRRNARFPQVLAARLTTTTKQTRPSVVELNGERLTGRVVCDDIIEIWQADVLGVVGGFTPRTMRAVNDGLKAALDIP